MDLLWHSAHCEWMLHFEAYLHLNPDQTPRPVATLRLGFLEAGKIGWQTNRSLFMGIPPYKLRQSTIWAMQSLVGRYQRSGSLNIWSPTFWWCWITNRSPLGNDSETSSIHSSPFGGRSRLIHASWTFVHPRIKCGHLFNSRIHLIVENRLHSSFALFKKASDLMCPWCCWFPSQLQVGCLRTLPALWDDFCVVVNDHPRNPFLPDCCKSWEFTQSYKIRNTRCVVKTTD